MDFSSLFAAMAWVLPILFAVTFHEAAHGWVAERLGDDTARVEGRVTFNPLRPVWNCTITGVIITRTFAGIVRLRKTGSR